MPRAIFAAEASRAIGGGHVMRSLALARSLALRGWQCEFAALPQTFATFANPVFAGIGQRLLDDGPALPTLFDSDLPDIVVFDRYAQLTAVEALWRDAGVIVVVIDDLADQFHFAHILLNQNQPDLDYLYAGLVRSDCISLFGPKYALLRPEFAAARETSVERRRQTESPHRVFVNFGLTDPAGGCLLALDALEQAGRRVEVIVAIGGTARDVLELQRRATQSTLDVEVHVDASDVAGLMAKADYAIGAGGGSAWERCAVGLPSIVLSVADNQDASCALLAISGAGMNLGKIDGITTKTVVATLNSINGDPVRLRDMGRAAAALCDGHGAHRVVDAIEALRVASVQPTRRGSLS